MSRDGTFPYLERHGEAGRPGHRVTLDRFPFRIGRSKDAEHTIATREVSSFHAEIAVADGVYTVRDLGSRNGTFVNGERVSDTRLHDGDILHIAHEEFRFGLDGETGFSDERTVAAPRDAQQQLIREANDLERVLAQRTVTAAFQPIVRMGDRSLVGYESLGRPSIAGVPYPVGELFRIASVRGEGGRLARLLRGQALADLPRLREPDLAVFFNLHPEEMSDPAALGRELDRVVAALAPGQRAVIEIHESAVTDLGAMAAIRSQLHAARVGLAYDDFGAGQSRLMELVEVPPDYLKLDMSLVRDIDRNAKRRELVGALINVMTDLGIAVLAEGIEREAEGQVCQELGCELAQGFFYGRPAPAGG